MAAPLCCPCTCCSYAASVPALVSAISTEIHKTSGNHRRRSRWRERRDSIAFRKISVTGLGDLLPAMTILSHSTTNINQFSFFFLFYFQGFSWELVSANASAASAGGLRKIVRIEILLLCPWFTFSSFFFFYLKFFLPLLLSTWNPPPPTYELTLFRFRNWDTAGLRPEGSALRWAFLISDHQPQNQLKPFPLVLMEMLFGVPFRENPKLLTWGDTGQLPNPFMIHDLLLTLKTSTFSYDSLVF